MINLSDEQLDAIELCADISQRIVCVTGQAGTGKTTILKNSYESLESILGTVMAVNGDEISAVVLAAPTGRAAKRIEEATGIPAMTIHRMLRYTTPEEEDDKTYPRHTRSNPMPYECILIDEASMIDEELWNGLIAAMKKGSVIRFFGDINQLPPVMSKSPFKKALEKFPTVELTHNYRSDDGIIAVSDKVIRGRIPTANERVNIYRIKSVEVPAVVTKLCNEVNFMSMDNQIIAPTQRTKHGCDNINKLIQQKFNQEKEKITIFQKNKTTGEVTARAFKRGDKVLWTKNDYTLEIMNGTLGRVIDFDAESGVIRVNFEGSDYDIPPKLEAFNPTTGQRFTYDPRNYLMLGYAITTHKSQGSQFDTVLYALSASRAATRQNLYTAITRAKYKLVILNAAGALAHALNNKVLT